MASKVDPNVPAPPKHTHATTPSSHISATQVFDTVELAEHILSHLPIQDILRVQQVNKHLHTVIESSSELQRCLMLKIDSKKDVMFRTSTPWGDADPSCDAATLRLLLVEHSRNGYYDVPLTIWIGSVIPMAGSRIRKMQICTPPVRTMECWLTDYGHDRELVKENGITWGDIIDATLHIRTQRQLDRDESPDPVDFFGDIRLLRDDPAVRWLRDCDDEEDRIEKKCLAAESNGQDSG